MILLSYFDKEKPQQAKKRNKTIYLWIFSIFEEKI